MPTSEGHISAASTPIDARNTAFFGVFRNLNDCHTFRLFQSLPNMFGKRRRKITDLGKLSITFCNNPKNVPKLYRCMPTSKTVKVQWFWKFQLYHLISSRRSRKRCSLRNEYLLAKIDADTTENVYLERRSVLIKYEIDAKHTRF